MKGKAPNRKRRFAKWMPAKLVCALATIGPIGLFGKMPGTLGSVVGLGWFAVIYYTMIGNSTALYMLILLASVLLAIVICDEAEICMGKSDPGEVIIDEVIALPFCFFGLNAALHSEQWWIVLIAAFALFRFFDILKPLGISKLQSIPGGFGVVIDDVAAGLATCLVLNFIF